MIKEYNNNVDYMDLCIQFECKKEKTNTVMLHWQEVLKNINNMLEIEESNKFWYNWLLRELNSYKKHVNINDVINEFNNTNGVVKEMWAFVTVGFNPQEITPEKMIKACKKIRSMKQWIYCDNVLEKHRENGEHHHAHFLIKIEDPKLYYTSKIVELVFKYVNSKYESNNVLNKNMIDVKGPCNKKMMHATFDIYYQYVRGNKKVDKLKYVAMDDIWRNENNIDKLYIKE